MSATDFGDPHQIIHIPARDLTGTREAKLADLDMFLAQLQLVRLALCGQTVRLEGFIGGPNEPRTSSPLTWSRPAKRLRAIRDLLVRGFLKVLLLFSSALCVSPAQAQTPAPSSSQGEIQPAEGSVTQQTSDPWRGVTFGATIETFYQYNWNRSPDRRLVLRAYDTPANTFGLQQAAFVIDAAPDVEAGPRFGARVDLQFGMATDTVQGNPANEPHPELYRHLWQVSPPPRSRGTAASEPSGVRPRRRRAAVCRYQGH